MSAVWIARHPNGTICAISSTEDAVQIDALQFGWTVTRETLLTPAQAAVLEAAKAFCDKPRLSTEDALKEAVTTLRAQEGECVT